MFFNKLLMFLVTVLPLALWAFIPLQVEESIDKTVIRLQSCEPFGTIVKSRITGAVTINFSASYLPENSTFEQHKFSLPYLDYYILQSLSKETAQLLLKEGPLKFNYFISKYVDSLYHCDIYVFPVNKVKKSALALYLLGVEYQDSGNNDKAIEYFRKSITLKAQNGNAYYRAGQIRMLRKEYGKALINFKKAAKYGTDSLKNGWYMAQVLTKMNKKREAGIYEEKYLAAKERFRLMLANNRSAVELERLKKQRLTENSNDEGKYLQLFFYVLAALFMVMVVILIFHRSGKMTEEVEPEEEYDEEEDYPEPEIENKREIGYERLPAEEENIVDDEQYTTGSIPENYELEAEPEDEEKIRKARELELGVGELDLALNIRSKLKNRKRLAGKEEFIIEMYNQGLKLEEIAKELNLNYGEVDLVIGLNKHRLLKHRQ